MATIEDLKKLNFIIAQINEAEEIEGADKLYKLTISTGPEETRTIVAGIKKHYSADELVGKKIVLVENLEPVTLRGVESQGMLLAASNQEGELSLIVPEKDINPGARIS